MCYQLIELYSACRCLYYQHAIDQCSHYGHSGHKVTQRIIFVGYKCTQHASSSRGNYSSSSHYAYSDSGYQSGQSHKSSNYR